MSKVHRKTLEHWEMEAEERLSLKNHREVLGPYGYDIHLPAELVLRLCADSERLSQIERLAKVVETSDTEGLRTGAAAMEREVTKAKHE